MHFFIRRTAAEPKLSRRRLANANEPATKIEPSILIVRQAVVCLLSRRERRQQQQQRGEGGIHVEKAAATTHTRCRCCLERWIDSIKGCVCLLYSPNKRQLRALNGGCNTWVYHSKTLLQEDASLPSFVSAPRADPARPEFFFVRVVSLHSIYGEFLWLFNHFKLMFILLPLSPSIILNSRRHSRNPHHHVYAMRILRERGRQCLKNKALGLVGA